MSSVDISPTAFRLARRTLERAGYASRIGQLVQSSVSWVLFKDELFDGIIEACVCQHLDRNDRVRAFGEVGWLKPGRVFVRHIDFQAKRSEELLDAPGTLLLMDRGSKLHLTNIGLSHFYRGHEIIGLLRGFSQVDPCLTTYYLPREEARKRGYGECLQSMWTVSPIKLVVVGAVVRFGSRRSALAAAILPSYRGVVSADLPELQRKP